MRAKNQKSTASIETTKSIEGNRTSNTQPRKFPFPKEETIVILSQEENEPYPFPQSMAIITLFRSFGYY